MGINTVDRIEGGTIYGRIGRRDVSVPIGDVYFFRKEHGCVEVIHANGSFFSSLPLSRFEKEFSETTTRLHVGLLAITKHISNIKGSRCDGGTFCDITGASERMRISAPKAASVRRKIEGK